MLTQGAVADSPALPTLCKFPLLLLVSALTLDRMHEFNQSLKYDKRMYAADVKGSIAFSKALLKAGIMNAHEQQEITRGLKIVESEWAENKVRVHGLDMGDVSCLSSYDSLSSNPTMKTSTLPMSEGSVKLLERTLVVSCIPVEAGTIKSLPTCESGL